MARKYAISGLIEIVLPGGVMQRVDDRVNASALRRVLALKGDDRPAAGRANLPGARAGGYEEGHGGVGFCLLTKRLEAVNSLGLRRPPTRIVLFGLANV